MQKQHGCMSPCSNGMGSAHHQSGATSDSMEDEYFIFRSRECGFIQLLMSFLLGAPTPGTHCSSSFRGTSDSSWQAKLVMVILKLLHLVSKMLASFGEFVEICLNTFHVNGGLLKLIQKLLSGTKIIIPDEDSGDYWSVIGFLDPRIDLISTSFDFSLPASRDMADICMMASKISYENAKVIRMIIQDHWKMHLVDVFECINKYEPTNPTQVLIFIDRPEDARAIIVAFRGTMPFNSYDWSTDFDFSWYELPGIGRVHVGFLEALSLVDRHDMDTFVRLRTNLISSKSRHMRASGLDEARLIPNSGGKPALAYDTVSGEIKELLKVHKNAKFYVTGHSLGGALATVFTTILFYNHEDLVTEKLAALYTFGQPRVGDKQFAATMSGKLNGSGNRFFRLVYSNDVVPRVPFDDFLFQFKHIQPCFFYTSFFIKIVLKEEPNKNYFSPLFFIPKHSVAVWELLRSLVLHYRYGESYRESGSSLFLRLVGLVFPGISAHSPVNYVNSIRLGPEILLSISN